MKARVSFEGSLEGCLQELARTGDLEASLRRYPEYAERLRPLLETAQATRQHYTAVPEPPGGLALGRERLLATAEQDRKRALLATGMTRPSTRKMAMVRRMKLAFPPQIIGILLVVLIGTVALGGGVVWAAGDSLPGDLLYPVKTATEDIRLALASTAAGQVELALGFVDERTDEFEALAAAGRNVPDEAVARMERHVERALTQAARASDEELGGLLAQIQSRTRTQLQALERVQAQAPGQAQTGLARALAAVQRGAEAAESGLSDPERFRWRFQHRRGEPEPTSEPEPGGEREQHRNQEHKQQEESTPVGTPHVTPQGPKATSGPRVTPHGPPETPGPKGTTESSHGTATPPEPKTTSPGPMATTGPEATSQGPMATTKPEATPQGPGATAKPKATPPGAGATAEPQPTSQGPGATAVPQPTTQGPGATAAPQPTAKGPGATSEPPGKTPDPGGSDGGRSGGH